MQEWAEVHRLFYRENRSKPEIAERLGMSRTTVYRLLAPQGAAPLRATGAIVARSPQTQDHRSPAARRQLRRDHDRQGLSGKGPLRVPLSGRTSANDLSAGRDWPHRLVGAAASGPCRQGPFSARSTASSPPFRTPPPMRSCSASTRRYRTLGRLDRLPRTPRRDPREARLDNDASIVEPRRPPRRQACTTR